MQLKQRFLEAKAKKTRRNDHGRGSANGGDQMQRGTNQSKLKRQAGSPLMDCGIENLTDSHSNKIPRSDQPCDKFSNSAQQQTKHQKQQSNLSSFSVQIVQQFSNPTAAPSPLSQTVQTNVTVQGLSGGLIKSSNSPAANTSSIASPGCATSGTVSCDAGNPMANPVSNGAGASTGVSVNTSVECKQEPDTDFAQCSVNGSIPLSELSGELNSTNNDVNTTTSSTAATTGDRFSDSLANLGFPEDSNDDVIHPDLLKDIIDDVFTNPSDLMNGFNFIDSLGLKDSNHSLSDDKDSLRPMMSLNKSMQDSPPSHFQNSANSPGLFSMSQTQTVFDFPTRNVNSNTTSQALPNNSNNIQSGFNSGRMGSFTTTSQGISNSGLGLDFKLTEPSPAAQTLKQMAEQHQNMQQKQQQLGLGVSPRSPFESDSFPDPLSNIRSNFLNGSPNSMNSLQKSPTGIFQSMGFAQQVFSATSSSGVKQEVDTPNTSIFSSNLNQHLSDLELHKRRQALQMQQSQVTNNSRPTYSPEQKRQFSGIRQLPTYNDPSPGHPQNDGSTSNSPHHPGSFMRSTPPPPQGFVSSPSPSAMRQSQQQIQLNANNQQIQLSQSQQQLLLGQDMKPVLSAQQQHQHIQARLGYSGQTSVQMSQSQSLSFQFPGSTRSGSPTINQRSSVNTQTNLVSSQRQLQQHYMTRPPPDYQTTMQPSNSAVISALQTRLLSRSPLLANVSDNMAANTDQNNRNVDLKNSNISVSKSYADMSQAISVSAGQSFSTKKQSFAGIPTSISTKNSKTFPGVEPIDGITTSKPFQNLSSIIDEVPTTASKNYPGIISFSDELQIPGNSMYSDLMSASVSRPFAGLNNALSSTPTSASESFRDLTSISNAGKSYMNSVSNPISASMPKSYANGSSPSNSSIAVSKTYPGTMSNSHLMPVSISQPYTGMSSASISSQGQSQMMPITTIAPTYSAGKSRTSGKQITSRASKQNGPYHRQQKPPNVNVGPEGLNISQRPPVMSTDWRHIYIQQSQQQISNINAQLRMTYPRNTIQNYGQNAGTGSNYQSHHINPNSPTNGNNSLSISSGTDQALSGQGGVQQINSVTNHMLLQQQAMIDNENNILGSSRLHLSNSITPSIDSMSQSQQIFSPSPSSNSSQIMVSDNNQFSLDFLDNLDCSTSDLLNFDVLQEGNTSFPSLEDIG